MWGHVATIRTPRDGIVAIADRYYQVDTCQPILTKCDRSITTRHLLQRHWTAPIDYTTLPTPTPLDNTNRLHHATGSNAIGQLQETTQNCHSKSNLDNSIITCYRTQTLQCHGTLTTRTCYCTCYLRTDACAHLERFGTSHSNSQLIIELNSNTQSPITRAVYL